MSKRHEQSPKLNRRETEAHGLEVPVQKTQSALEEGPPANKQFSRLPGRLELAKSPGLEVGPLNLSPTYA